MISSTRHEGDEIGFRDLVDRLAHEGRGIVGDADLDARRGRPGMIRASSAFTRSATSRALASDCLTMPRPTAGRPL